MAPRAEQKRQTHERIVRSAARRLAVKGFNGASVDAVMADAGLTHGGFYAHFGSKKQMIEEALSSNQDTLIEQIGRGLDKGSGREALNQMLARYLGKPHRDRPAEGCLLPVLVGEAPHQNKDFKSALQQEVDRLAREFAERLDREDADDVALGLVVLAVGGIALSRAVEDDGYSDRILRAARLVAHAAQRG
jgi:TetR/AcrR family transcriptional repressor of nem operon